MDDKVSKPLKVLSVFGTRPEAIKMAPVVLGLEAEPGIQSLVCVTAQHREMLDQVMAIFDLQANYDLDLMRDGQDLFDVTTSVLTVMRDVLREARPDMVLVHGDTTTCLATGLAAFYEGIKIGHVEAGLRTGSLKAPFPEEANRALVGRLTNHHFAPTEQARINLLAENTDPDTIHVTGNTVIDALLIARDKTDDIPESYWRDPLGGELFDRIKHRTGKFILITGHRRENFGQGFIDLCNAIKQLAERHPDWELVYPVHLNPNVQKPVKAMLSGLANVHLLAPQQYLTFVWLMQECDLILTDSGGIQEEGPALGKPVLVMRELTERPEAIAAGTVRLVGTDMQTIDNGVDEVLSNEVVYQRMAKAKNPYGDGQATKRILATLRKEVCLTSSKKSA